MYLYLLPLLITAGAGVYYYYFRTPTHMKKYEAAFVQKYGRNTEPELVKLPPEWDVTDEKVLQKLCSYAPPEKKSVANSPVKERNNFVGFRVEIHEPIPVQLIRCNETYAVMASLTSERIFVLKKATHIKAFKERTVFYLEAEVRFDLPPKSAADSTHHHPVIPKEQQSSEHDAQGHSDSIRAAGEAGIGDESTKEKEIENDRHHSEEIQPEKSSSSDSEPASTSVRRRAHKKNRSGEEIQLQ